MSTVLPQSRKRILLKRALFTLAALLLLNMLLTLGYKWYASSIRYNTFAGKKFAAAVVFNHYYKRSTGGFSEEGIERLNRAEYLYEKGIVDHIICVGGAGSGLNNWYGSYQMREYLASRGIPREKLLYDSTSTSTTQNWENARNIILENGWSSALLTSSPLHIVRIKQIAGEQTEIAVRVDSFSFADYFQIRNPLSIWFETNLEMMKLVYWYIFRN